MTEDFPTASSEASNADEIARLQTEIRGLVDEHTQGEPLPQPQADRTASRFGLAPGEYDAFPGSEGKGDVMRFRSKVDGDQTAIGVERYHEGGNVADPNRRYTAICLHADGTVTTSASVENSHGIAEKQAQHKPSEPGYEGKLNLFLYETRKAFGLSAEFPRGEYWETPDAPEGQPAGPFKKMLGKLGLRGPGR